MITQVLRLQWNLCDCKNASRLVLSVFSEIEQNCADVGKSRWCLTCVDQTQPQLIVFERFAHRVSRVILDFFADWLSAEHKSRMLEAAVKDHVVLDKLIESRHAQKFSRDVHRLLISKHKDTGPHDINLVIFLHEINLRFEPLWYRHIVCIHPCNVIDWLGQCNLNANVKCIWKTRVGLEPVEDYVGVLLFCAIE